jgi:hypothetical protein
MRFMTFILTGALLAGAAMCGEAEPSKEPPKVPAAEEGKFGVTPEQQKAFEAGNYSMYTKPGKEVLPSETLSAVMWEVMQTQYKETPPEKKTLPKGFTDEDLLKRLKERVPQLACVRVTAEEDANFKAGKFDEIHNYTTFMDFNRLLTTNKVPIPETVKILERDKQVDGRLRGAHLELAVRLSFMSVSKLYLAAERQEKK